MSKRWAVIDSLTKKVVNVIMWDGQSRWAPPAGTYVVECDTHDIGDSHNPLSNEFTIDPSRLAIPDKDKPLSQLP